MKKIFSHISRRVPVMCIIAAASLATLSACNEEDPEYLSLGEEMLSLEADGGKQTIGVRSNTSWEAASDSDWVEVLGSTGKHSGDFSIVFQDNYSVDKRSAVITVQGREIVQTLLVEQGGMEGILSISDETVTLYKDPERYTVHVIGNCEWEVYCSSEWCKIEDVKNTSPGSFTVSAEQNDTGRTRTATISVTSQVKGKVLHYKITIEQQAVSCSLTVPVTEYLVSKEASVLEVTYIARGGDVTVKGVSGVEWVSVQSTQDTDGVIRFDVQENTKGETRQGQVSIYTECEHEPMVRTLTVWQSPTDERLDIFFPDVNISPMGETILVPVNANIDITLGGGADWLEKQVTAEGDIEFTAEYNNTEAARVAIVSLNAVLASGETLSKAVRVTQEYQDIKFEFDQRDYDFSYRGETKSMLLYATGEWEMTTPPEDIPEWMTISPTAGDGIGSLSVAVETNLFARGRKMDLVFTNTPTGKIAVVTISQEKDPASAIDDYAYLGKGYDITGDYANARYVKEAVLDWTKLEHKGYIAAAKTDSETVETKITGSTLDSFKSGMSASFGVSTQIFAFSASVKTSFSREALETKESEFGLFRSVTRRQIVQITDNIAVDQLKDCLTESAAADINGTLPAADLFAKYGTHIIAGFSLGGSLDYWMSADQTNMETKSDFSTTIKAGFKSKSVGVETEAGYSSFEEMKSKASHFEERLTARGGDSQYASGKGTSSDYSAWLASLNDPQKWTLVDYEGNKKLIPIWELAISPGRRHELEQAAAEYINGSWDIVQQGSYVTLKYSPAKICIDDVGVDQTIYVITHYANLDGQPITSLGGIFDQLFLTNYNEGTEVDVSSIWSRASFSHIFKRTQTHTLTINLGFGHTPDSKLTIFGPNMLKDEQGKITLNYNPSSQSWSSPDAGVIFNDNNTVHVILEKIVNQYGYEYVQQTGYYEFRLDFSTYNP